MSDDPYGDRGFYYDDEGRWRPDPDLSWNDIEGLADGEIARLTSELDELRQAAREFVHAQAVLTGDPVRASRAGERLVELGVIEESERR